MFIGESQTLGDHLSGEGVGSSSIKTTLNALLGPRYKFQIKVNYANSNELLPATYVNFKLYVDSKIITDNTGVNEQVDVDTKIATFEYTLSESVYREKVVSYVIHPE